MVTNVLIRMYIIKLSNRTGLEVSRQYISHGQQFLSNGQRASQITKFTRHAMKLFTSKGAFILALLGRWRHMLALVEILSTFVRRHRPMRNNASNERTFNQLFIQQMTRTQTFFLYFHFFLLPFIIHIQKQHKILLEIQVQ